MLCAIIDFASHGEGMADDETPGQHDNGATRPDQGAPESPVTVQRIDAGKPLEGERQSSVYQSKDAPTVSIPSDAVSQQEADGPDRPRSDAVNSGDAAANGAGPEEKPSGAGEQGNAPGAQAGSSAASSPWSRPGDQVTDPAPGQPPPPAAPVVGGYQPMAPYPSSPAGYPSYPAGQPGAQPYPIGQQGAPGYPAGPQGVPPYPGTQGFQLPPVGADQPKPASNRRKIVVAGVALAVLVALLGGGIGGLLGYRFAANDGRLGSVSAAQSQAAIEQVADKVLPSVVQIRVSSGQLSGAGSGMIISPDGLILTNNHVVDMIAHGGQMSVLLFDGRSVSGKILARDSDSDIALVQAQKVSGLSPISLGNSDPVRIGQTVIAVGSPLGLGGTVTSGIVSALSRAVEVSPDQDEPSPSSPPGLNLPPGFSLPPGLGGPGPSSPPSASAADAKPVEVLDAIQTDAAINPGNSGGPLIDLAGNVVGINTAIASFGGDDQSGSVGLGFSIPINQAKRIMQQLRTTGKVTKALLGVEVMGGSRLQDPTSQLGATVAGVSPGGAADKSGLKKGDIIVKVGNRPVLYGDDLVAAMRAEVPGETVTLTLSTGRTVQVVLGSAPSSN
jgi:putative serine protease PepD